MKPSVPAKTWESSGTHTTPWVTVEDGRGNQRTKARSGQRTAAAITATRGARSRISLVTWRTTLIRGRTIMEKAAHKARSTPRAKNFPATKQENRHRDENTVGKGGKGVGAEPGSLAGSLYGMRCYPLCGADSA